MRAALLAAIVIASTVTAATAKPMVLNDQQLDDVNAGQYAIGPEPIVPPVFVNWPNTPPSPGPIVNPGGPILISCTIGVGCTTRHF